MSTASEAEKSAVNGIRTALGVGGVLALIVGILILVWPGKTAAVVTVGSSRVDLQACKLEYSIVSPK